MISDERFSKKEHLKKTKDFRKVFKEGARFKKDGFLFYSLPNNLGLNRLGFSISSKNIKLSVRRNRYKRLLKEAYRRNKKNMKQGYDIVLVLKKDIERSMAYNIAEEIFLKLAGKADLLT